MNNVDPNGLYCLTGTVGGPVLLAEVLATPRQQLAKMRYRALRKGTATGLGLEVD